jgi:hypothetical protein
MIRSVPHDQELPTLPENLRSPPGFSVVRVDRSFPCSVYKLIILIELMYTVFVPSDWTRVLSPVCF